MVNSQAIIAIEDSDTDFMALQFALQSAGIMNPLERCASGRGAKESLLEHDDSPLVSKASLILLDLNLPGLDGRHLLKALRARDPKREVPVIVLTTSSHPRDIDDCYSSGADAYLVKPLELDDWETKVGALAGQWLRHRIDDRAIVEPAQELGNRVKSRNGQTAARTADLKQLTRAIETEVIPRLLLAFNEVGPAKSAADDAVTAGDRIDRIAQLARLAMERDADVTVAYVEAIRAKDQGLETVFHELIAPAARHVGDLWKADRCDFSQFSRALQQLQRLLAELNPVIRRETLH